MSIVDHAIRCQNMVILNVLGFEMLQKNLYFYTAFQAEIQRTFCFHMILLVKVMLSGSCRALCLQSSIRL
jgi:hypothetical protein